jgi:hypothetical protein
MAHITLAGVLLDPTGEFSVGDKVRFTHQSTTGNTIKSAVSGFTVPPNGAYSINLEYGLVLVEYSDSSGQFKNLGVATVNATNTATSIPELLNALVPVSSAELIQFQAILANTVTAQNAASASASASALSATDSANSAASVDWASIRYSKLDNPLVHLFKKNKIVETLSGALTWTRATTATYVDRYGVLKTAAVDEPREEKEGSLIEGTSTNRQRYSANIDLNQGYNTSKAGSALMPVITPNFSEAPDGTMTASRGFFSLEGGSTGGDQSNLNMLYSANTGATDTYSIWIKSNTELEYKLRYDFNGSDPTRGEKLITATAEWKRFTISKDDIEDANRRVKLRLRGDKGTSDTADILMWGAQVEALPFASSYIHTTSSPATRAADIVTFNTEGNVPDAQGPWSILFSGDVRSGDGQNRPIYQLGNDFNNSDASDGWTNYVDPGSDRLRSRFKQEDFGAGSGAVFDEGVQFSSIWVMNENRVRDFYVKSALGDFVTNDASTVTDIYTDPSVQSRIMPTGLNGHISDFRIYDFALNAAEVNFLSGE